MTNKPDGGPAFPLFDGSAHYGGMSLRQYAAIHLKVADSGTDWLDDMIRKAKGSVEVEGDERVTLSVKVSPAIHGNARLAEENKWKLHIREI